jgi:hypothetical protein
MNANKRQYNLFRLCHKTITVSGILAIGMIMCATFACAPISSESKGKPIARRRIRDVQQLGSLLDDARGEYQFKWSSVVGPGSSPIAEIFLLLNEIIPEDPIDDEGYNRGANSEEMLLALNIYRGKAKMPEPEPVRAADD